MTAPAEAAPVSARQREREAYRRSRARRSTLVSFASTAVFAVVAWLVVTGSPGWPRVQATFFSVEVAREAWPRVVAGLWVNLRVLAVAAA